MCPIGAAIVDHDQKRTRKDISEQGLTMLKCKEEDFWRRFVTVDETWIHHYIPKTVEAVVSAEWKCAEKGEDRFISRRADGHCFLGCSKNRPYWLFAEESNNYRGILCNISKPFVRKTANGTSETSARKNPFSSQQRTGSKFCLIHPILLIWLLLTSFYFQTWRSGSREEDFRLIRRLSPLWMSTF